MIYLYTKKQDGDNWILRNDWYFNLYSGNQPFTEKEKKAVEEIDAAKVLDDLHIETEYGLGTIRNLSSGCKTYLNIVRNPEKIVCADECGGNVLSMLFQLDEIHIFMNKPERFFINDNTRICFNEKEIAVGRKGYERWWSAEYERRAGL